LTLFSFLPSNQTTKQLNKQTIKQMATGNYTETFHDNAVRAEVTTKIVNMKANVCPMTVRLAWHASGTFDKQDSSGGSDGATMRFEPELSDKANAGLDLIQDLLAPVKKKISSFILCGYLDIGGSSGSEALWRTGCSIQIW